MKNHISMPPATDTDTVLIVDDEESMRSAMRRTLDREKISNLTVGSVEEAIKALKTQKFSMVLLDWGLCGAMDTSGAEVLRFCKETYPLMPVIVMSGLLFDWRTDATTGQADGVLAKPFNSTLLVGTVNQWLNRLKQTPKVFLPQSEKEIVSFEKFKNLYIRHVVKLLNNNISDAAAKLGIHRQTVAAALKDED